MTEIGDTIRDIRLVERIGEGGMGEVFVGVQDKLGRQVAIKALRIERRMDATAKARFIREAHILSALEHPNICRLYDLIEEDGCDYIVLELVRGKTARVNGNLHGLLMLMKGQPLAYNRDNQEDKELLFDSIDTTLISLQVYAAMMPQISLFRENMRNAAEQGFATATDLADYLVRKAIPFRDAHEIVGKTVSYAIEQKLMLVDIPLITLQGFCDKIGEDVYDILSLEGSLNARDHIGGTAPNQVRAAVERARARL